MAPLIRKLISSPLFSNLLHHKPSTLVRSFSTNYHLMFDSNDEMCSINSHGGSMSRTDQFNARRGTYDQITDYPWQREGPQGTYEAKRVDEAILLASNNVSFAARHLLDIPVVPTLPTIPTPPKPTLPPLYTTQIPSHPTTTLPLLPFNPSPTLPTQPTLPKSTLPLLPSTQIPTLPTTPPSLPATPLPTIPTTIPSIPTIPITNSQFQP
ncbi:heat shock 22 kDa protein, mitochondrial-like [Fagus crenata]